MPHNTEARDHAFQRIAQTINENHGPYLLSLWLDGAFSAADVEAIVTGSSIRLDYGDGIELDVLREARDYGLVTDEEIIRRAFAHTIPCTPHRMAGRLRPETKSRIRRGIERLYEIQAGR